jgi:hypothetical protein
MEDRRLLANHLEGTEFRRVSGALRRFAQLRAERKEALEGAALVRLGLTEEEYYRVVLAYLDVAAARMALSRVADYDTDPWPLPVQIDAELEKRAREQLGLPSSEGLFVRRSPDAGASSL